MGKVELTSFILFPDVDKAMAQLVPQNERPIQLGSRDDASHQP
jgi:hypothetical protein